MKALILSCLVGSVGISSAHAEGPPPGDSLLERKSVGVMPILTTGPARQTSFRAMASVADRVTGRSALKPSELAKLDANQGFSFAGASTELDIMLLQMGTLIGGLALEAQDEASFKRVVGVLQESREALAALSPAVVSAYDRFVAAAAQGKVDSAAIGDLFMAAEAGIATGPQRGHGYFLAGLWFGLAMIDATLGNGNADFAAMAGPLATMFEEDADLGGSDVKFAVSLRQVARLLIENKGDSAKIAAALSKVFEVGADTK